MNKTITKRCAYKYDSIRNYYDIIYLDFIEHTYIDIYECLHTYTYIYIFTYTYIRTYTYMYILEVYLFKYA
jgi:hypothetical protein